MSGIRNWTRALVRCDEDAWRRFHEAYHDRLVGWAMARTCGCREQARDAVQAGLLRMVRHMRVFDDETVFWSWQLRVMRTVLIDEHRRRSRYLGALVRFREWLELRRDGVGGGDGDCEGFWSEGLAGCSVAERQLLRWRYEERRTLAEIALAEGVTVKAIEGRLGRLRKRLREAGRI